MAGAGPDWECNSQPQQALWLAADSNLLLRGGGGLEVSGRTVGELVGRLIGIATVVNSLEPHTAPLPCPSAPHLPNRSPHFGTTTPHLVRQVEGGALGQDVHLIVDALVGAVLPLGQHPAVGLAVHGLGAQGGGHEEHAALATQGLQLACRVWKSVGGVLERTELASTCRKASGEEGRCGDTENKTLHG